MDEQKVRELLLNPGFGPALESETDAKAWLVSRDNTIDHYIDGAWVAPSDNQYFSCVNPATGEELAQVAEGSKKDVDKAFAAAQKASKSWAKKTGFERARILYSIARKIKKHAREIAVLESLNNGKSIRETRDIDIPLVIKHFEDHAGWAQVIERDYPNHKPGGVVAQIIPWNFPLLMFAWKIAPALAAGNTIVIKPAETTPVTAARLVEIFEQAGLPRGVLNIVNGKGVTGALIAGHKTPWKIAFTGSTEVGKIIRLATAGTGKCITCELGGKSPALVFADSDLDAAVEGAVDGPLLNQGHVCCACTRFLIEEKIFDIFVAKLKRRISTLVVAKAPNFQLDKSIDIGAVNSLNQLRTIERLCDIGEAEGAIKWQPDNYSCPTTGYYYKPTVFTNVTPSNTIALEEIFGPVFVCMSFRTKDEAIDLANNTKFGLAASVWTENIGKAVEVATKIKAGTIWINSTNLFDANSEFGGYRESGYGREGGREGILEYLKEEFESIDSEETKEVVIFPSVRITLDRTNRLLIAGKLARPDGEKSFFVKTPQGINIAELSDANRKDVRNAVEAARLAVPSWAAKDAHLRAQLLRFVAENISNPHNQERFVEAIIRETGRTIASAEQEVALSIERLFYYAGRLKSYESHAPDVAGKYLVVAKKEPIGVVAVRAADEYPLLSFVSALAPLYGFGNALVMLAGNNPLAAVELIQILENSDIPASSINILTSSNPDARAKELAEHEDVDAIWYFGTAEGSKIIETASIANMKRTWCDYGKTKNWLGKEGEALEFLRQSVQIKNIWVPFGA